MYYCYIYIIYIGTWPTYYIIIYNVIAAAGVFGRKARVVTRYNISHAVIYVSPRRRRARAWRSCVIEPAGPDYVIYRNAIYIYIICVCTVHDVRNQVRPFGLARRSVQSVPHGNSVSPYTYRILLSTHTPIYIPAAGRPHAPIHADSRRFAPIYIGT